MQITVLPGPRGRPPWERLGSLRGPWIGRIGTGLAIVAGAVGAVATVAVVAFTVSPSDGQRAAPRPTAGDGQSRLPGAAGVAAAYHYPLRCLSVTTAASDRAYARAELDRASPCWRYGAYVTAIFHRADGAWRLVLDAGSYTCPVVALPRVVQAQLAVCPPARRR